MPLLIFNNTFQYNGALTWTSGAHNIKFGGSLIRRQFSLVQSASAARRVHLQRFGDQCARAAQLRSGELHRRRARHDYSTDEPCTSRAIATWEFGAYAQDDWRVNNWLTLNLGVRYDIFTAKTEQYNRLSNFDPVTVERAGCGAEQQAIRRASRRITATSRLASVSPRRWARGWCCAAASG